MNIPYFLRKPFQLPIALLTRLPIFSFIRETNDYQNKSTFEIWFIQKILGIGGNRKVYWPVNPSSQVFDHENIYAGIDTCPGLMKGCYIQGRGGIWIGDYTQIAPNVVIVSANHDPYDLRKDILKPVVIGNYSWIGANSSILPSVVLGPHTIIGAGSVVTKSYPEGYCVIAGNPAKKIRDLDPKKCIEHTCRHAYYGYKKDTDFQKYREKHLNIDTLFR